MRSQTVRRLLEEIDTPEYKEKRKQESIEGRKTYSLEYQLGIYVGEHVAGWLPVLSVDNFETRNIIKVSEEDTLEHERLHDLWYNKRIVDRDKESSQKEWDDYRVHTKMLNNKYVPKEFRCHLYNTLNLEGKNIEDFKKGIQWSLWDCDYCHYEILNLDEIKIEINDEGFKNDYIVLKYREE